jgi:hypothetical protein
MTIYDATANGPAVVLIGENRGYAIGDTAYKFERQKPGLTLPNFAGGTPVAFIDGAFRPIQGNRLIKNWTDKVTKLEA